jgi:hypothetical protein
MGRETHHTNGIAFLYGTAVTAESLCCVHPFSAVAPHRTSIRRGFASSAFGKTRVITPSRISALILS